MRVIDTIILHCSDSQLPGQNAEVIRTWHTTPVSLGGRGWKDIGYHAFIGFSGLIEQGRAWDRIGAHCEGHNGSSIGICLAGKTPTDFNRKQFLSLTLLLSLLKKAYPEAKLVGHCDLDKHGKTCPVFDVEHWKALWNSLY